jgi:hypothetical protein
LNDTKSTLDPRRTGHLSHDLSNALEIIVQANYLLGAMSHDEAAKQWTQLLDNGVVQAADINRRLREYIVANS